MALPIQYNIRSVLVRWRSTLSTIFGIGLVVAVYVMMQSLAIGLEQSSANTGDPRNLLLMRKGSTAETSSQVTWEQFKLLQYLPGLEKDEKGEPLISADTMILITLARRGNQGEANILVRGVTKMGIYLRPQVELIQGRMFEPGRREVIVSQRLAERFEKLGIGETFKTGGHELTVVGWIDGHKSAFDSEIWMDSDDARSLFDRENYSSVLLRADPTRWNEVTNRVESDKRLPLMTISESKYYSDQTATATPIRFLGNFLATAMSIGAVFAAMNTMYASVGSRTREVGTLRVLGFRRRSILIGFLIEGAILAFIGGALGCLLALPINHYSTGTLNFQTFSEVVFEFNITLPLIIKGLVFAVTVGLIGSLFPAIRASRLPVIASLKSL